MKKILLIVCAVALSKLSLCQVPTTGLIGRWEFTGNLQDGSPSLNNGTWMGTGNPVYIPDRCNNPQSAIKFNGTSDFIQMAAAGIVGSGARSVSFWMRTNNTTFGGPLVVRAMFNDGEYSPSVLGTRWEINHNYQCQGIGTDISMEFITNTVTCINNNRWHHIVVTQAANSALNTVSIYVDGTLITTNCSPTTNSGLNNTLAQAITIGAVYLGAISASAPVGRYFDGDLDDFYYYNTTLNANDVSLLYYDKCNFQNTCGPQPPQPTVTPIGCCIGNPCPGPLNLLPTSWQVPLRSTVGPETYNFTSLANTPNSQVNVGFNACINGQGRLNVVTDANAFAGTFVNNNGFAVGNNCVGIAGRAVSTNINAYGVRGQAMGAPANFSADGVNGESNVASGASFNNGIFGQAANGAVESSGGRFTCTGSNSPENYGVKGLAASGNAGANRDVGGLFSANIANPAQRSIGVAGGINVSPANNIGAGINSLPIGIRIGVYGYRPNINPPPPTSPATFLNWAGYFDGYVRVMGNGYVSGNMLITSDKRFKKNIQNLKGVVEKLQKVNGYTYEFKTEEFANYNFPSGIQTGFIAQELKEVFPQVVCDGPEEYNYVNYQAMIPILVEAIKEQQKQIDAKNGVAPELQQQLEEQKKLNEAMKAQNQQLNDKLNKLEQMINSCCAADQGSKTGKGQTITLTDKNVIVLNQNVPNPFAESAVITYSIPMDFAKAQLIFNTNDGKIIKTVEITTKGDGYLNVFANDLSNGLYSYTLVIDGKVIATKKMVKQN